MDYSESIDLSQPWSAETSPFLTVDDPVGRWVKRVTTCGMNDQTIETTPHVGTHIDAPFHFIDDGYNVETIDFHRLFRSGVVVASSDRIEDHGLVQPEMSEDAVEVRTGDIVILHTGYHCVSFCLQEADLQASFLKHPGAGAELPEWAVEPDLGFLGLDTSLRITI